MARSLVNRRSVAGKNRLEVFRYFRFRRIARTVLAGYSLVFSATVSIISGAPNVIFSSTYQYNSMFNVFGKMCLVRRRRYGIVEKRIIPPRSSLPRSGYREALERITAIILSPLRGKKGGVGLSSLSTIPYRLRRTRPIINTNLWKDILQDREFTEGVLT